jgi:hypothetical protein
LDEIEETIEYIQVVNEAMSTFRAEKGGTKIDYERTIRRRNNLMLRKLNEEWISLHNTLKDMIKKPIDDEVWE